jgi:hypothetical protein
MRRALVLVVVSSCEQPVVLPPPSNQPPPPPPHQCRDRTDAGRTLPLYAPDIEGPGTVDESFGQTWDSEQWRLQRCRSANTSGEKRRVAIHLKVNKAGAVTEVSTHGPDPTVDRCVCDSVFALTFPPQSTPVVADFAAMIEALPRP